MPGPLLRIALVLLVIVTGVSIDASAEASKKEIAVGRCDLAFVKCDDLCDDNNITGDLVLLGRCRRACNSQWKACLDEADKLGKPASTRTTGVGTGGQPPTLDPSRGPASGPLQGTASTGARTIDATGRPRNDKECRDVGGACQAHCAQTLPGGSEALAKCRSQCNVEMRKCHLRVRGFIR